MVALGLAAIISVSIMMISSQARMAYEETVKKVDVYNRFRYALRSVEEDLKNWVPTGEMEFYTDGSGQGQLNSHWDHGEQAQDERDDLGVGVLDGGIYGEFDEFAFIEERQYKSRERGQASDKWHDAFRLYFQTMTYIDGATRLANVEYFLKDPNKVLGEREPPIPTRVGFEDVPNLSLVKVIRYFDVSPTIITAVNLVPVKRVVVEIATNVTDFRVEYSLTPGLNTRRSETVRFFTPKSEFDNPYERAARPIKRNRTYLKRFGYGSMKLGESFPRANGFPGSRGDRSIGFRPGQHLTTTFGFRGNRGMQFAQLVPGDKIYVFTESNRGGRNPSGGAERVSFKQVKPGDYTIKANRAGELEFEEDLDSTDWNGQTQSGILYKAPFLPAAVRITLRVVDDLGQNPKTLQKVIWVRRRSI